MPMNVDFFLYRHKKVIIILHIRGKNNLRTYLYTIQKYMTHPHGKNYFFWQNIVVNKLYTICNGQKLLYIFKLLGKKMKKVTSMGSSHVLWRWDLLSKPFVSLSFATLPVTLSCAHHKVLRLTWSQEFSCHYEKATRRLTFILPYTSSIDLKVEECLERTFFKKLKE